VNQPEVPRGFTETRYASSPNERRILARIEASGSHADDMLRRGIYIRYVVSSLKQGGAEHIYETMYCAGRPERGTHQAAPAAARRWPIRCD
jgi:hypothetical protein